MSFSSRVKSEMCEPQEIKQCCAYAQAYGLLLFGRSFSSANMCLVTEHEGAAMAYKDALEAAGAATIQTDITRTGKITVSVPEKEDRIKIINFFGHGEKSVTMRVNFGNMADDCCYSAFLRGAFLSCGTISDPKKNYHLEYIIQFFKLSNDLMKISQEHGFSPKYVSRKGNHVVYFKESEQVEDLLTAMGAGNCSLELMGIKLEKNVRNSINRKVNFETANIDRAVNASLTQVHAIKTLMKSGGFDNLTAEQQMLARLRLENPESTLQELGEMMEPPLSRSGVYHRLDKLVKAAEEK